MLLPHGTVGEEHEDRAFRNAETVIAKRLSEFSSDSSARNPVSRSSESVVIHDSVLHHWANKLLDIERLA